MSKRMAAKRNRPAEVFEATTGLTNSFANSHRSNRYADLRWKGQF